MNLSQLTMMPFAILGCLSSVNAENFPLNPSDVLLGIMATGGDGESDDVFFNLGLTTSLRDNPNRGIVGNIGSTLSSTYGVNWFNRTDLFFGVYGNLSTNVNSGIGASGPVNGDPSRTTYVSRGTTTAGTGIPWEMPPDGLAFGGGAYLGIKGAVRNLVSRPDGSARLRRSEDSVGWNNGWSNYNPGFASGMTAYAGGIQSNFGTPGTEVFVDVQRILSTNTGANPAAPEVGVGQYVATVGISANGNIRIFTASPAGSSPFATWVATFPALVSSADREPTGDFDQDGVPNINEFAFGGSPVSGSDNGQRQLRTDDATGDSQRDLTLTVEVRSGTAFAVSGNKLTATQDGVLYTIEGSLDLVTFESAVSEVNQTLGTGTPKAGYIFKTFRLNASAGLNGKGFIRARAAVAP